MRIASRPRVGAVRRSASRLPARRKLFEQSVPGMKYRKLGNSELLVSEIGFGSWLTFTDPQRKQLAISCVHRALDLGINFLNTENVYGRGAAETVMGRALTGVKRGSYVLATKLLFAMSSADQGLSRQP